MTLPINPVSRFENPLFNPENTGEYSLVIQSAREIFSYLLFDPYQNEFALFESYPVQEEEDFSLENLMSGIIQRNDLLKKEFRRIDVIFESNKSTLIPTPLYNSTKRDLYLSFNHITGPKDQIMAEHLHYADAWNVFAVPDTLCRLFRSSFSDPHLHHFSSILLETLLLKNKNRDTSDRIFLNVRSMAFDIIYLDEKKLVYYNAFEFTAGEDMLYYLLFVMEQLKINPEKAIIECMGMITQDSALMGLLRKYIRTVRIIAKDDTLFPVEGFNEFPFHRFYYLSNISLCEL